MALKPVSDPSVLAQLSSSAGATSRGKPVTDPAILAQLEGEPSSAPSSPLATAAKNLIGYQAEPALQMATGMVSTPLAGLAGMGAAAGRAAGLTDAAPADVVERVSSALTYQPRTAGGQAGAKIVNYPFEKLAQGADRAGDVVNAPAKPRISGAAANYGLDPMQAPASEGERAAGATLVNTAIQSAPALLLRGGGRTAPVGPRVASSPKTVRPPAAAERPSGLANVSAPTKETLKRAAEDAYKRADESGVVVTPESFGALKEKIAGELREIDPTLHPDATAALKRVMDSEGALSLQKLETLRRIAKDAEGSIKPADQRLAGKIVDEIDDYIEGLTEKDVLAGDAAKASALKEARGLYSRAKKAEELDRLVERAELTASNFSGSGMENALRTEFRALAKNDRKIRRFTKEEQEAIRKVATGAPLENALRLLGKFAPTGIVSSALSAGAGFIAGGPAGAALLPAAGGAARYGAARMTMRNATRANELVRRGPQKSDPKKALSEALSQRVTR